MTPAFDILSYWVWLSIAVIAPINVGFADIGITAITLLLAPVLLTFLFVIGLGIEAQLRNVATGIAALIDATGEVVEDLTPYGQVKVQDGFWKAKSLNGILPTGTRILIISVDNLTLNVTACNS